MSATIVPHDTVWTESELDDLRREFAEVYGGRTVLVTSADGFKGSHLTEALCALGTQVHAFVRGTSSGALSNIRHLRSELKVHFADLTDRTSVDYLVRELCDAPWPPRVSWEEGVLRTIRWYAANRERWLGRVDWPPTGAPQLTRAL